MIGGNSRTPSVSAWAFPGKRNNLRESALLPPEVESRFLVTFMKHTLSVLVEDEAGVLTRIAGLFARRGFNIDSLAVGPAETVGISRITMVVQGDD